jgi:hypothetical protein
MRIEKITKDRVAAPEIQQTQQAKPGEQNCLTELNILSYTVGHDSRLFFDTSSSDFSGFGRVCII